MVTTRPVLSWAGTSGYENDGVEPNTGFADETTFELQVRYKDADGDPPSGVFVHITLNDAPIPGSPFRMERVSGNYTQGALYRYRIVLETASSTKYAYYFTASDGLMAAAGTPTQPTSGPRVFYRPQLSYTKDVGYEIDGVEPQAAQAGTRFTFAVLYRHKGGKEPQAVRLHLASDGTEIVGSPFLMSPVDAASVKLGRKYRFQMALPAGKGYVHWFSASDGTYEAFGEATAAANGPLADQPPRLTYPIAGPCKEDGIDPNSGGSGATEFVWQVSYQDADGDPPAYVVLRLYCDGKEVPGSPYSMMPLVGGSYTSGKTYEIRKRLTHLGQWSYSFAASDGHLKATGPATELLSGPQVTGAFELLFPPMGGVRDDGLYPNSGRPSETPFTFAITYRHGEKKAPARIQVYIRNNRETGSVQKYDLEAMDARSLDKGRTYTRTLTLSDGNYSYWFEASDGTYVGRTDEMPGPQLNHKPLLAWVGTDGWTKDGVDPDSGEAGKTLFTFRVKYSDPDGDFPTMARVYLYSSSEVYSHWVGEMTAESWGNPKDGIVYKAWTVLPYSQVGYRYRFVFSDGYGEPGGEATQLREGPTVQPAPAAALVISGVRTQAMLGLATVECQVTDTECWVEGWVTNMSGRRVAHLAAERVDARTGRATLRWNYTSVYGSPVPAGPYFIVLEARSPSGEKSRRVVGLWVRR
jgi:hypothetical protein